TELAKLAEKNGVALNFEAAVAGGIPVIKTLREALAANHNPRVYGILNGTCNYILTQMQAEHRSFGDVLAEAQAKGYAEADPTFDIGGFDPRPQPHPPSPPPPSPPPPSSPCSPASPSARASRLTRSTSRASRRSPRPTSRPPTT